MSVFVLMVDCALVGVYSSLSKAFTAALADLNDGLTERVFTMDWRVEWGGRDALCCYCECAQGNESLRYVIYQDAVDYQDRFAIARADFGY